MVEPTTNRIFLIEQVYKKPPGPTSDAFILSDISFEVYHGEILCILGPSGAGKSTLLRLLNGLDDPDRGRILFKEKPIDELDVFELRRRVGMVFQRPALLPGTVRENLTYPLRTAKHATGFASSNELMKIVGLPEYLLARNSDALSVGQQQRAMIARALVTKPEVMLMDEPTSALDPSASKRILRLARQLQQDYGLTVIFVTHAIQNAKEIADRVLFLMNGRLQAMDDADRFFSGQTNQMVNQFLSGELDIPE